MVIGQFKDALGNLVDRLVKETLREVDERFKVILLSPPDSAETLKLAVSGQ